VFSNPSPRKADRKAARLCGDDRHHAAAVQGYAPLRSSHPCEEREKTHGGIGGRSLRRPTPHSPQLRSPRPVEPPFRISARRFTHFCGFRKRWMLAAAVLVVLAASAAAPTSAAPSRDAVCVDINPVIALGCSNGQQQSAPAAASGSPSTAETPVALSATTVEHDPERIAVMVESHVSTQDVKPVFARARVQLEQAIPAIRSYLVRVDPDRREAALRALRSSPLIARAAPDVIAHVLDTTPDDSDWPLQTGLRVVGFPRAWDTSRGSSRVTVAVVDTGVDLKQADLQGALVAGANFVTVGAPPSDDHGHGTAVAGIIAARSNNRQGITGACWLCMLMPVKVLDKTGSGDDTRIAAGIVWAADHGARVINLSLGGPGTTPELTAALAYAARNGVVVVAAAGNSGTTIPFYPAADANVLSVAATTSSDQPYNWTNFGAWVNVAAPGCNIAPLLGDGYGTFCGTSSASPLVAAIAALALSVRPTAPASQVVQAIEQSTKPVGSFVHFGRVDAPDTLAALAAARGPVEITRSGTLTHAHRTRTYEFQAAAGQFTATARFSRGRITLTLTSIETGAQLARIDGSSPLSISQVVTGPVKVSIHAEGRSSIHFALAASFTR
jgi:subtilisin family serine protease